jgi:hypothetical protein
MLASLHLTRWPLGRAQAELWQARRHRQAFDAAMFATVLLPIALRYLPLPEPRVKTFGYLAVWPRPEILESFRASALADRWDRAASCLELTLQPIQSFGTWRGIDPLAGARNDPAPGPTLLVTHSRTRPARFPSFLRGGDRVASTLRDHDGHIWADGFIDRPSTLDSGTLSLWRAQADAIGFAYGGGVHREMIEAARAGGWFIESWFGRFAILEAKGSWPGLDVGELG